MFELALLFQKGDKNYYGLWPVLGSPSEFMGNLPTYRKQQAGQSAKPAALGRIAYASFIYFFSFKIALYLAKLARDKAFLK